MSDFDEVRKNTLSSCCGDSIDENLECEVCGRDADGDIVF